MQAFDREYKPVMTRACDRGERCPLDSAWQVLIDLVVQEGS